MTEQQREELNFILQHWKTKPIYTFMTNLDSVESQLNNFKLATPSPTFEQPLVETQPKTFTLMHDKSFAPSQKESHIHDLTAKLEKERIHNMNKQIHDLVNTRYDAINMEGRRSTKGHVERFEAIKLIKTAIEAKIEDHPDELINFEAVVKEISEKLKNTDSAKHKQFIDGISEKSTRLIGGKSQFAKMREKIEEVSIAAPPSRPGLYRIK